MALDGVRGLPGDSIHCFDACNDFLAVGINKTNSQIDTIASNDGYGQNNAMLKGKIKIVCSATRDASKSYIF